MDGKKYDEFGNLVGDESDSSSSEEEEEEEPKKPKMVDDDEDEEEGEEEDLMKKMQLALMGTSKSSQIVQYEDKQYYPSSEEIYGPEVETMVETEDMQPLEEPIIKVKQVKTWQIMEKSIPKTEYGMDFLSHILSMPHLVHNVAFVGNIHSGKTSMMDHLVTVTHPKYQDGVSAYLDNYKLEIDRGMTLKASPMTLILETSRGKSHCFNIIDTPGHVDFNDEVCCSLRLCDGAVVFVDAVEGVLMNTRSLIRRCLRENVEMVFVINKVDRLILELRLPPNDAYMKLLTIVNDLNQAIESFPEGKIGGKKVCPIIGNVCFSSTLMYWNFTLLTFAKIYTDMYKNFDPVRFSKRLWGDWYFDSKSRKFHKSSTASPSCSRKATFVEFILEPLYKIYSHLLGNEIENLFSRKTVIRQKPKGWKEEEEEDEEEEEGEDDDDDEMKMKEKTVRAQSFFSKLRLRVRKNEVKNLNFEPLLRLILKKFFKYPYGLVDMMVSHLPSAKDGTKRKIENDFIYGGSNASSKSQVLKKICECDENGPLVVYITKFYDKPDPGEGLYAFGRVLSGTLECNDEVYVYSDQYVPEGSRESLMMDDSEGFSLKKISRIWINNTRYRIGFNKAVAGTLVLLDGGPNDPLDDIVVKYGAILGSGRNKKSKKEEICVKGIFRDFDFDHESVVKLSVEPLNPSELSKMIGGLKKVEKTYPNLICKAEESGEHVLIGTGELYLDSVMYDLREKYSGIEVKTSDPVVIFRETIAESSSIKCKATTPNKKNKLCMIAQPLEKGLCEKIEARGKRGRTTEDLSDPSEWDLDRRMKFFSKFNWDLLSAKSFWSFGPSPVNGSNILMNETFPHEISPEKLGTVKQYIVQGFKWATKEGPLIEEPLRNVKFKLIEANIANEVVLKSSGQIIPTARRVVNSAYLTATPRIMEPIMHVEIVCPMECIKAIMEVLDRRRGHILSDKPNPGTPFYTVLCEVPALDVFGFETDVRTYTQGQAFPSCVFHHWDVAPGDPLDDSIVLKPLEPSPPLYLAREMLVKTRRRKGLAEEVSLALFLDEEDREMLKKL